ncbi:hypothetical protein JW848_07795 [Candidatus Bipolaricaulota bacterium]|nr:hypothetical protein [Candidatus Bipolaricaulota bacterium]
MPASEGPSLPEIRRLLIHRYGIRESFLDTLRFVVRNDEIWVTTAPESHWESIACRPVGIRALRLMPRGIKPTSAFLMFLGREIRANLVAMDDRAAFEKLLLGRPLPTEGEDGFVGVAFRGDVIGCGEVRRGELRLLLATERRNSLLHILQRASE